jgi:Zn-dependent protease with chaperone function
MQIAALRALSLGLAAAILAPLAGPVAAQTISNPSLFAKSLQAAHQAVGYYGSYHDLDERARVNRIGYALAQQSGFEDFPFSFYLVEMPVPNAFALPGGHIFITRGMLDLGLDDDMLASLLGHEIAHVVYSHGMKMQKRAQLFNILSQVLTVGVAIAADGEDRGAPYGTHPADPRYNRGGGDRVMGAAAAGMVISELLLRSYSRDFEDEADDEGQRMAAAAGFDPDGARKLFTLMQARLPQTQEYGYWQTHPFFEQRVRSASVRQELLKIKDGSDADAYRQRTQQVLLDFVEHREVEEETVQLLKYSAVMAWPAGPESAKIRLEYLYRLRDRELEKPELARDFGRLIDLYVDEIEEVRMVEPDAPLLKVIEQGIGEFETQRDALYPKALEVYENGVFETGFLETFASNYPTSPHYPKIALSLGDAYSRLQRSADAVEQYLAAWTAAPESDAGKRSRAGLKVLAARLDQLTALQHLAEQDDDFELQQLAESRLESIAGTFDDLENGADYLKNYPDGSYSGRVGDRINQLAEDLYGEIVLYQTVGDHAKALDGITRILTQAPLSPAAERLRERAVLES